MASDTMAVLTATRTVLWDALRLMSSQQRTDLLDLLSTLYTGPTAVKPPSLDQSAFLQEFMNELERIAFRIRQPEKFRQADDAGAQQAYFVCIKCQIPIAAIDTSFDCPGCGSAEWIEMVHTSSRR